MARVDRAVVGRQVVAAKMVAAKMVAVVVAAVVVAKAVAVDRAPDKVASDLSRRGSTFFASASTETRAEA